MKICEVCGAEIINGENGCTMAGNICFKCKPWKMKTVPAHNWWGDSVENLDALESRCLDMGREYNDLI